MRIIKTNFRLSVIAGLVLMPSLVYSQQSISLYQAQSKGDTDSNALGLNYLWQFDKFGSASVGYNEFDDVLNTQTKSDNSKLSLIKLGYAYPIQLNSYVELELAANGLYSLSELQINEQTKHSQGSLGLSYSAGLNWKLSSNLSLKLGLEKYQGLDNLTNLSTSYIGLNYRFASRASQSQSSADSRPSLAQPTPKISHGQNYDNLKNISNTETQAPKTHITEQTEIQPEVNYKPVKNQEKDQVDTQKQSIQTTSDLMAKYMIQVGVFAQQVNVEVITRQLQNLGYQYQLKQSNQLTKVLVTGKNKAIQNKAQATTYLKELNQALDISGLIRAVK